MNYNFDQATFRRNTNSYKWDSRTDVPSDIIPLWVADMDFRAAPPILEALQKRVSAGIFGYTYVPDAYYEAISSWFWRYHDWKINRNEVIYTSGVVPAVSAIIKALTRPGDKVLVQTPVYNCFFSSIRNNGCEAWESELIYDDGYYRIDFADLEMKTSDPRCTLMLLCNPHNPAARVWTVEELSKIADICHRHSVIVVADEIHCELVYEPYKYTPFALVGAEGAWVSCISPSKAFNIAGLQIANIVAPDDSLRRKIDRAINDNEVCDVNPFGVDALIAAYTQSRPWLEALLPYLYDNYRLLKERFAAELPAFTVTPLEGTYLAWVNCRSLGMDSEQLEEVLIKKAHVWLNAGSMYGKAGEGFMRINLACQRQRLQEAIDRLIPALKSLSTTMG